MSMQRMALAGIAATCVVAQPVSRNLPVGQQPMAVAVNESTKRAYIVSHNSSSVTVIDGRTRTAIATIKTGAGPEAIAVNPVTNRVYTANSGASAVSNPDGADQPAGEPAAEA